MPAVRNGVHVATGSAEYCGVCSNDEVTILAEMLGDTTGLVYAFIIARKPACEGAKLFGE